MHGVSLLIVMVPWSHNHINDLCVHEKMDEMEQAVVHMIFPETAAFKRYDPYDKASIFNDLWTYLTILTPL